jgi:hypothetical protein
MTTLRLRHSDRGGGGIATRHACGEGRDMSTAQQPSGNQDHAALRPYPVTLVPR